MHRIAASFIALVVFSLGATAQAQVFADDDATGDGSQVLYFSSTTTTTTAVGVAMIVATVALVSDDTESAAVETYLRNNAVAVQADLALGAGESIDDLAEILAVPAKERSRFARALRGSSAELMELARLEALDAERARQFVRSARTAWLTLRLRETSPT